jgi:ABC-type multidrug transport system ATPase subunit
MRPGQIIALRGRPGSGRTALLLSMGGYYRGSLPNTDGVDITTIEDGDGEDRPGRTALGLVANAHEPEPMLTAREHLDERVRLLRKPFRRRRPEVARRAGNLPFPADTLARDLDPLGRHQLMLHVALVSDPDVILIDDIDLGLTATEQETLLDQIRATGAAAVVTTREEK